MPGGTEWKKRYDAKYPGQFQVYSPYFYDATMMLADAMKRANSWDPKVYIPFLQKADRKSTRLNSSHLVISYAVFCLKKKKTANVALRPQGFDQIIGSLLVSHIGIIKHTTVNIEYGIDDGTMLLPKGVKMIIGGLLGI